MNFKTKTLTFTLKLAEILKNFKITFIHRKHSKKSKICLKVKQLQLKQYKQRNFHFGFYDNKHMPFIKEMSYLNFASKRK